jgi:hypothetical protein
VEKSETMPADLARKAADFKVVLDGLRQVEDTGPERDGDALHRTVYLDGTAVLAIRLGLREHGVESSHQEFWYEKGRVFRAEMWDSAAARNPPVRAFEQYYAPSGNPIYGRSLNAAPLPANYRAAIASMLRSQAKATLRTYIDLMADSTKRAGPAR